MLHRFCCTNLLSQFSLQHLVSIITMTLMLLQDFFHCNKFFFSCSERLFYLRICWWFTIIELSEKQQLQPG